MAELPVTSLTGIGSGDKMTTKHWLLSQRTDRASAYDHQQMMISTATKATTAADAESKRNIIVNMHSNRRNAQQHPSTRLRWTDLCLIFAIAVVILNVRSVYARSPPPHHSDIPRQCKWQRLATFAGEDGHTVTSYVDLIAAEANSEDANDVLTCKLKTIDGVKSIFANMSGHQTDRISALRFECSDNGLFQESVVPPGLSVPFLSDLRRLQQLQIDFCRIRHVPAHSFSQLFDLRRLSLRSHNAAWSALNLELHRDSFHGLTNLQELDLSANNIWTLPNDVFCPITTLRRLQLANNQLTDVNQLGFSDWGKGPMAPGRSCNTGLETLDISENSLASLPDNGFTALRSLSSLLIQENHLKSLADRSFVGLQNLKTLNMSSNQLMALPPELFHSPRMLQHLHLQNNSLRVLAPGLLEGLDRLEELDLSRNELTSEWVNRNTFAGLIRLVVLKLGFNQLTKIDQNVFRGLYSLQVLNLEHNRIESIADYALMDLKNLHILTLSHNQLKQLDAFHFSDLYVLNQLMLDSNRIESIHERAFENITHLHDLYLNDNYLDEIPNLARLKFLQTLDMGKNQITNVRNESFEGLEQLVGLRLTDNLIRNITRDAFITSSSLQVLNLASNRINHIDQSAFISNPTLRAIRLDANELEDISSVFTSLTSLVWLNVSGNRLRSFDYSHFPNSLEWLDIHDNNVSELGNYFDVGNNLQLKMLDISHNKLTFILDASIPNSIETIFLNNNEIKTVAAGTFASKPFLQKVVLYGNQLRHLEIAALALPPISESREMPQFYMGHNPFHCDCNLEWLQRINDLSYLRQHPHVADLDQIQCVTVEHQQRAAAPRAITQLQSSEFLCQYESHCFALCHCCDFDACDCKMTCPDRCACFHDHSWSANIVDCGSAGYSQIPERIPMDATTIYLDGNDLANVASHQFIGKKKLEALYLNGSNINALENGTFNGLTGLRVLHLESNNIEVITGHELGYLSNLRDVNLDHNQLRSLASQTFTNMKSLERLSLAGNTQLKDFELWDQLFGAFVSGSLQQLSLDGVQLRCDCESLLKFRDWQKFIVSSELANINALQCNSGKVLGDLMAECQANSRNVVVYVDDREEEKDNEVIVDKVRTTSVYDKVLGDQQSTMSRGLIAASWPLLSIIVAAVIASTLLLTLVCVFRQDVRVWAHAKYNVRLYRDPESRAASAAADSCSAKNKLYDAYVLYNLLDAKFAVQVLAGELQHNGYALFLHHRDIQQQHVYQPYVDSVHTVADISKKVVLVLSAQFVHNEWQQPHFRAAFQTLLESVTDAGRRRHKFLVILAAPIELIAVDHLMQTVLRTCSVVCWGEKRFWDKLRYLLPDIQRNAHLHHHFRHPTTIQLPSPSHHHPNNRHHHQQSSPGGPIILHQHHHESLVQQQVDLNNCMACKMGGCEKMQQQPLQPMTTSPNSSSQQQHFPSAMMMQTAANSNLRYTPAPTTLDSWPGKLMPATTHNRMMQIMTAVEPPSSASPSPSPVSNSITADPSHHHHHQHLHQMQQQQFNGGGQQQQHHLLNNLNVNSGSGRQQPSRHHHQLMEMNASAGAGPGCIMDTSLTSSSTNNSGAEEDHLSTQQLYTGSTSGHVYSTIPENPSSEHPSPLMGYNSYQG